MDKKYCTSSLDRTVEDKPYRTSPLVMPAPKTINDFGVPHPLYQPYRGPQYSTQKPSKAGGTGLQYNSPRPLYSDETVSSTPPHPGYIQDNKPQLPANHQATLSKPHESETFKRVLESEMDQAKNQQGVVGKHFEGFQTSDRPNSQQSNIYIKQDPLLKNNSINQSASFKKIMHSVLGETEF
jgi:hypothetical protein